MRHTAHLLVLEGGVRMNEEK